jgi:hypothetical protein
VEGTIYVDDPIQGQYKEVAITENLTCHLKIFESKGLYNQGSGYRFETSLGLSRLEQYGSSTTIGLGLSLQKLSRSLDVSFIITPGYQFNQDNGLNSGPTLSVGLWVKKY